jgi:hypothetical protein
MTRRLPVILLGSLLAGGACTAAVRTEEALTAGRHSRSGELAIAAEPRESGEAIRWQTGALTRGGAVTAFNLKGLEVGASGFEGLVVVGEVYDLDRPEDFAGTYQRVLATVADADAPRGTLVGNEHGVLLMLRSADGEAMVGPGPDGILIEPAPAQGR